MQSLSLSHIYVYKDRHLPNEWHHLLHYVLAEGDDNE